MAAITKENLGRRRQERFMIKLAMWVFLCVSAYSILWRYYLAGINVPDVEIDSQGVKKIRRRPDLLVKKDPTTGEHLPNSPLDGILHGRLSLIDISVTRGLIRSGDKPYTVKGTFCAISWNLQETDPSKVPMFRQLVQSSPLCSATMYEVDLWEVTRQAMDYDNGNSTAAVAPIAVKPQHAAPTAVVFHQTRCGSTLVANLLASTDDSRVYSESPPPVSAFKACDSPRRCDPGAHSQLIQDVFYMMGRGREKRVFYKIQSIGVHSIAAFTKAMPDTPWMFVYRDPVEIMMSHFKNFQYGKALSKDFMAVCLRSQNREPHESLVKLVQALGKTVDELTKEEYCAAHLASLAAVALDEYEADHEKAPDKLKWFVNYEELPHKIWETVVPQLITPLKVDKTTLERMKAISHSYSKGAGSNAGTWTEDSTRKHNKAPKTVREAAKEFLNPLYEKMEAIRKGAM
jgi:hypothetical protein